MQPSHSPDDKAPISLEELSATFAALLQDTQSIATSGDNAVPNLAETPAPAASISPANVESASTLPLPAGDDGEVSPRGILEAMLFVGSPDNAPLTAERAASLMRGVEPAEVHDLVRELNAHYAAQRCPYHIIGDGPGYRLTLRNEFHRLRDRFYGRVRQARLSQAAIDVLALVAYHEPLTADEVNKLRGISSQSLLTQLVRRQLLQLDRLPDAPKQPRYRTTQRFLELFGLTSRDDLPRPHEVS